MHSAAGFTHTNDLCVQKFEIYCSKVMQNEKKKKFELNVAAEYI